MSRRGEIDARIEELVMGMDAEQLKLAFLVVHLVNQQTKEVASASTEEERAAITTAYRHLIDEVVSKA